MTNSSIVGRPGRRPFSVPCGRRQTEYILYQVRRDAAALAETCNGLADAIGGDGAETLGRMIGALTAAAEAAETLRRAVADPAAAWMDEEVGHG